MIDTAEQSPQIGQIRRKNIHGVEDEKKVRRMTLERKATIIG